MINKDNSEILEIIIKEVLQLYYVETKIKPIDVQIEIVDDLHKRKLELAGDDKEKQEIILSEKFTRDSNGTIMLPNSIIDVPHILISKMTIDDPKNNPQYISTVIHELTHIHDFYDFYFLNKDKCSNIRGIDKCRDFHSFQLWTEYNARRKGYYFYRKIMNGNNNSSEKEQIEYILHQECQFHMNYLREQLIKNQNNPYNFVYHIIQFIGRFSVWNDLFPNDFNINTLPNELLEVFDTRIVKLYEFLYINKNFNDIKYSFNELDSLLSNFVRK